MDLADSWANATLPGIVRRLSVGRVTGSGIAPGSGRESTTAAPCRRPPSSAPGCACAVSTDASSIAAANCGVHTRISLNHASCYLEDGQAWTRMESLDQADTFIPSLNPGEYWWKYFLISVPRCM